MKTRTFLTGCLLAFAAALQAQNLVGGDLSMLPKYEAASVNYYDMQGNRIGEMLPFLRVSTPSVCGCSSIRPVPRAWCRTLTT